MHETYTIIGDPHLKHSNLDVVGELFELVERKGNPTIWLGDMLDTKEVIRGRCLNTLINYFAKSRLTHYVLVGNHDWFNLTCEAHGLQALTLLPNVRLIDKPTVSATSPFVMVPYVHDQAELKRILAEAPEHSVLIAHLDMVGYDYGNGHVCKEGLKLSDLKKFRRVISGHFHKYQDTDDKFTYLGTPFSHSFGESNQKKFIGTYDTLSDELVVEETQFRRHVSIEFNCDLMNEEGGHWFTPVHELNWKKHFYRIILTGKQENIDRFPRHIYDEGGAEGKLNVKWITRPTDSRTNDVSISDTLSNEQQFWKWASDKGLDEATTKLGLEILEVVK